jgi:hemolysin activation/secretion protein
LPGDPVTDRQLQQGSCSKESEIGGCEYFRLAAAFFFFDGIRDPMKSSLVLSLAACMAVAWCSPCVAAQQEEVAPAVEDAASAAPFDIDEYRILGNSQLQAIDIEKAVYPHLGPGRSIKDVEQARDALATLYRDRGYGAVYVDIPEQDVTAGIVRLKVTEGQLDRVRITGARYFANGHIRALMPSAQRGMVLNTTTLQKEMGEVNRQSRDLSAVPVLRAGREPGKVDLEVQVEDHLPLHATFELNDRYTANTSRTRAGITLSFDNLFQANHSLSLQYQTAPSSPEETRIIAATYSLPVGGRNRLALYAVDSNSDVAAIGTLSVLGAGSIFGARGMISLPDLGAGAYHSLSLGADYKDFTDTIRLTDSVDETPISYLSWNAQYARGWSGQWYSGALSFGPTFGVRHLFNSSTEFAYKRYRASPSFFHLRGNLQQQFQLPAQMQLALRASGQWTSQSLISNEQFAIGGQDTVRGYLESAVLGDRGVAASLELRSPSFAALFGSDARAAYLHGFTDRGYTRTLHVLPGQDASTSLLSYGAGLRVEWAGLNASLDWAVAQHWIPATRAGDQRIHFGISYAY